MKFKNIQIKPKNYAWWYDLDVPECIIISSSDIRKPITITFKEVLNSKLGNNFIKLLLLGEDDSHFFDVKVTFDNKETVIIWNCLVVNYTTIDTKEIVLCDVEVLGWKATHYPTGNPVKLDKLFENQKTITFSDDTVIKESKKEEIITNVQNKLVAKLTEFGMIPVSDIDVQQVTPKQFDIKMRVFYEEKK